MRWECSYCLAPFPDDHSVVRAHVKVCFKRIYKDRFAALNSVSAAAAAAADTAFLRSAGTTPRQTPRQTAAAIPVAAVTATAAVRSAGATPRPTPRQTPCQTAAAANPAAAAATAASGRSTGATPPRQTTRQQTPPRPDCAVCFCPRLQSSVFVPCGHVLCTSCAERVRRESRRCHYCRGKIREVVRIRGE